MPNQFDVLVDMYPTMETDIRQAQTEGYTPEDVQAAIGRYTKKLGESGFDPATRYSILTGKSVNPPEDPGLLKRIGASATRGATLGFFGPTYEPDPYASTAGMIATDWLPELVGQVIPFAGASKLVRATGLPGAVAGRLGGGKLGWAAGEAAAEGLANVGVGGISEGVQQYKAGEFDPTALTMRLLQDAVLGATIGGILGYRQGDKLQKLATAAERKKLEAKEAEVAAFQKQTAEREMAARQRMLTERGLDDGQYRLNLREPAVGMDPYDYQLTRIKPEQGDLYALDTQSTAVRRPPPEAMFDPISGAPRQYDLPITEGPGFGGEQPLSLRSQQDLYRENTARIQRPKQEMPGPERMTQGRQLEAPLPGEVGPGTESLATQLDMFRRPTLRARLGSLYEQSLKAGDVEGAAKIKNVMEQLPPEPVAPAATPTKVPVTIEGKALETPSQGLPQTIQTETLDKARQAMEYWQAKQGTYTNTPLGMSAGGATGKAKGGTWKVINERRAQARVDRLAALIAKGESGTLTAKDVADVERLYTRAAKEAPVTAKVEPFTPKPASIPASAEGKQFIEYLAKELPAHGDYSVMGEMIEAGAWTPVETEWLYQAWPALRKYKRLDNTRPNYGEIDGTRSEFTPLDHAKEAPVPAGVLPEMREGRPGLPENEAASLARAAEHAEAPPMPPADKRLTANRYLERDMDWDIADDVADTVTQVMAAQSPEQVQGILRETTKNQGSTNPLISRAARKRYEELADQQLKVNRNGESLNCASPCEVMPDGASKLTDAEYDAISAKTMMAGIQRDVAADRQGFMGMLKGWANMWKEGGLWELRSFSEVARSSKDARAIELSKLTDQIHRQESRWRGKLAERMNESLRINKFSEDDYTIGLILDSPVLRNNKAYMAKQTPQVQKAVEFIDRLTREIANDMGLKAEERISDYFPHVFRSADLRAEAVRLSDMIQAGKLPAGVDPAKAKAILKDMQDVIGKVDAGSADTITYKHLPQAFKEAFFEHRFGYQGYGLSAVKALETYSEFIVRKKFWEPYLKRMSGLLDGIENGQVKRAGTHLVRDLVGLADKTTSSQVDALASTIRNFEFIRTLGFWNVGSSIRNLMGGHMFASVDAGAKAYTKGLTMAMQAARDKAGYLGRLIEESGQLADVPVWYAKNTGNGPVSNTMRWLAEHSGVLFNLVEKGNRRTSFFAGLAKWFDTPAGRKFGQSLEDAIQMEAVPAEALDYANEFVRRNQFRYGKADAPFFLRNPVAGTLFQYAAFKIKATEMLVRWAAQEGMAGKGKLATLAALGAGVAAAGDLAGVDLSSVTGAPVDFLSMIKAMQSASAGDMDTAKTHILKGVKNGIFETPFGPAAPAITNVGSLITGALDEQPIGKKAWNLFERDLLPSQARQLWKAYQNLEAGGSAEEFVQQAAGFPNLDTRLRLTYLQLLRDGRSQKAQDLLRLYKMRTGGTVPVSLESVRQARIEAMQAKLKKRLSGLEESQVAKLRRGLPESIVRLIQ